MIKLAELIASLSPFRHVWKPKNSTYNKIPFLALFFSPEGEVFWKVFSKSTKKLWSRDSQGCTSCCSWTWESWNLRRFIQKADWVIHDEQTNKQHFSLASASVFDSRFLCWSSALTSFRDRFWPGTCKPTKPFPPKVGFDWCFIITIENKLGHGCWTLGLLCVRYMF